MERIAFYGKGGVGKSTVAASVSLALARQGRRVLHVGCDPKHDSTLSLVEAGPIRTVLDRLLASPAGGLRREDLIMPGKDGIDCVEAGGPQSGVGCGGRAISRMFELFDDLGLLDPQRYDAVVFDVLGDVVCGGFAAPLRRDVAPQVIIVASEEMAAGYAANNITRAVLHYRDNGVCLAGMVVNRRDNRADLEPVRRLAAAMNTRILAVIPRTPAIQAAELSRRSILDVGPRTQAAHRLQELARNLMGFERQGCQDPTPLELEEVRRVMLGGSAAAGQGSRGG
ncbi:MAG TPA: ArsA-related P-loop ATPase [Myxococcota bacterium]|nr:ArsA-related P-loop ATPase [Myxococcota bacterium]HRY94054.1 ArsA-related P-loop ATPase [Myxococcota bacterium]